MNIFIQLNIWKNVQIKQSYCRVSDSKIYHLVKLSFFDTMKQWGHRLVGLQHKPGEGMRILANVRVSSF